MRRRDLPLIVIARGARPEEPAGGGVGGPPGGEGGGVLSPEKGTDCGLTARERWLSQPGTAKKRLAVLISYCRIGGLSESL